MKITELLRPKLASTQVRQMLKEEKLSVNGNLVKENLDLAYEIQLMEAADWLLDKGRSGSDLNEYIEWFRSIMHAFGDQAFGGDEPLELWDSENKVYLINGVVHKEVEHKLLIQTLLNDLNSHSIIRISKKKYYIFKNMKNHTGQGDNSLDAS